VIPLTVEQLADVVGGDLLEGADPHALVDDVVIDSRRVRAGSLFVALPGEHTDGHRFLGDALARGASACLVAADREGEVPDGVTAVVVDDCADALLGLGRWARDTVDPTVVAVTGSSGKTTTKDLLAAATSGQRRTVAPEGSFNNELGVPLTCCRLELDSELLVTEVGARGVGHVAAMAALVRPDVAVVTLVAGAHLEFFGSLEGVAQAKGELVEALGPDGVAVLNADDPRVLAMASRTAARVVTYGLSPEADWRAEDVTTDALARPRFTVRGVPVAVPLPGEHNVGNALAALAVADAVGVDLERAAADLSRATVSRWRMELVETRDGVSVLNDAYNANPSSMAAALKTLAGLAVRGRRWAVLGQMAELGASSVEEHDRIGRLAIRLGIDGLVVVGPEAAPIRSAADLEGFYGQGDLYGVDDAEGALRVLRGRLRPGDAVLLKASRVAGLERVAAALIDALGGPAGTEGAA
jgi:UDP-N-acetylmuramoyl-tripeptide--D-alanyl-D-alanine ligase